MKQNERRSNALNRQYEWIWQCDDDDNEARMKWKEQERKWSEVIYRDASNFICWTMQSKRHCMPMLKPESGNIYSVVFVILFSLIYFLSLSSFAMLTVWQNIWVFPSIRWIWFTSKYFNPLNDNSNCENVLRSMHPSDIYHIAFYQHSLLRTQQFQNERMGMIE